MDRRPVGPGSRRDLEGIAHVVAVAVGHEHDVAAVDDVGRFRAQRVAEPRVEEDRRARARADLDAGMAVPGDRAGSIERHRCTSGLHRTERATLGGVPSQQIAQNLAYINWTILSGLAIGSYAAVVVGQF